MAIRTDKIKEILAILNDGEDYGYIGVARIAQAVTGYSWRTCIEYVREMVRSGVLVRGRDSRFLRKKNV